MKIIRHLRLLVVFLSTVFSGGVFADSPNNEALLKLSNDLLKNNTFETLKYDKGQKWVSVGMGGYLKQYYSRDTFITFKGARYSDELRPIFSHAIDWFGRNQLADGYIPIWYRETTPKLGVVDLNMYLMAPFDRTEKDGGIRQVDHVEQFIEAIYDDYDITQDKLVLAKRYVKAEKAWRYLAGLTNDSLITTVRSPYAGPDWADRVSRSGKAAFVNAYWYQVTVLMARMSDILGNKKQRDFYNAKAKIIRSKFNSTFWRQGQPINCKHKIGGFYAAWVDKGSRSGDYFELDSNSLAVAAGLADLDRSRLILNEISGKFDYYVNSVGATRVLCGTYQNLDTLVKKETYHNGGYWYLVSYYLAAALKKHPDDYGRFLTELHMRASRAAEVADSTGLNEWYDENGIPKGGETYSWSIAFPIYLNALIAE